MPNLDCAHGGFFSWTLFHDISPAIKDLYDRRQEALFAGSAENSFIEAKTMDSTIREEQSKSTKLCDEPFLKTSSSTTYDPSSHHEPWTYWSSAYITSPQALREFDARSHDSITRILFIRGKNSYSRLKLHRDLFETLMGCFCVFPKFREFVLLFGAKTGENEIGPPHVKFHFLSQPSPIYSTKAFADGSEECAYALRFVEFNGRGEGKVPWSVRQTAVYHKFLPEGCSNWIFISISRHAEARLGEHFSQPVYHTINPFEAHVILLDTALANWRPYMIYLTEKTNEQIYKFVVASVSNKDAFAIKLDFEERQRIKQIEDSVLDIFVILDSTQDTVSSLLVRYKNFAQLNNSAPGEFEDPVVLALLEKEREIELCRQKLQALHMKVKGTIQLLSSLLDLGNGHALRDLAEEARKDNNAMRMLTEKGTQDAAAVKVLTVITLIYLPASAVANFFSTQLIQQRQNSTSNSYSLILANNWWVFWAVSIPLTAFTLLVWWLWVKLQKRRVKTKTTKQREDEINREEWRTKVQGVLQAIHKSSHRAKETAADYEKAIVTDALGRCPNDGNQLGNFQNKLALPPHEDDFFRIIE